MRIYKNTKQKSNQPLFFICTNLQRNLKQQTHYNNRQRNRKHKITKKKTKKLIPILAYLINYAIIYTTIKLTVQCVHSAVPTLFVIFNRRVTVMIRDENVGYSIFSAFIYTVAAASAYRFPPVACILRYHN